MGTVWPKPTGEVNIKQYVMQIDPEEIRFRSTSFKKDSSYWTENEQRFRDQVKVKIPKTVTTKGGGRTVLIEVFVDSDDMSKFNFF